MYKIQRRLSLGDCPEIMQECIGKLEADDIRLDYNSAFEVDTFMANRVFFTLDEMHVRLSNFKAWASMRAYYFFHICYEDSLFKIGRGEIDEISANSVPELLKHLADYCDSHDIKE